MEANYAVETFGTETPEFIVVNNYHHQNLVWNARVSLANLNVLTLENSIGVWRIKEKQLKNNNNGLQKNN